MEPDQAEKYRRRIAQIHGLGDDPEVKAELPEEVCKAELFALADACLGPDYDRAALDRVAVLQKGLRDEQTSLLAALEEGGLAPDAYVDRLDAVSLAVAAQCEEVLGRENFARLFGGPASEMGSMIDKEIFIREHLREKMVSVIGALRTLRVKQPSLVEVVESEVFPQLSNSDLLGLQEQLEPPMIEQLRERLSTEIRERHLREDA